VAVSDIALRKPLPDDLARDALAYVGCIAGAISICLYEQGLREAGFSGVQVVPTGADLNAYGQVEGQAGCCTPAAEQPPSTSLPVACCSPATPVHAGLTELIRHHDLNEYAASVQVYAVK
jgi:hypothetical protein